MSPQTRNALRQAASQGSAGGEPTSAFKVMADHFGIPIATLSPPVKTGGGERFEVQSGDADKFANGILEAVTDELLAHGEFSSGANNRSNAREAARVVIDMVRSYAPAQAPVGPGTIERMVTAAMDTSRLEAIEECARNLETSYPDHAWLNAACAAIRSLAASKIGLPHPDLHAATVSCSGTEIAIQCDGHDVKDRLMDFLTGERS